MNLEEDYNVAAYQLYQELLDVVRNADQADDATSASTDASMPPPNRHKAKMSIVVEESEPERDTFSEK